MTKEEEDTIRQQCHVVADVQADAFIKAIKEIDKNLPAGTTDELRSTYILQSIKQASEVMKVNAQQMTEQMIKQTRRTADERKS